MLGQHLHEEYLSESFVEIINQIKESMETIMQVNLGVGVFLFSAMELVHLIEVQNLLIVVVWNVFGSAFLGHFFISDGAT